MPSFRKNALPSVSLIETQRPKALSRDASGQELGLFADVVPLELGWKPMGKHDLEDCVLPPALLGHDRLCKEGPAITRSLLGLAR